MTLRNLLKKIENPSGYKTVYINCFNSYFKEGEAFLKAEIKNATEATTRDLKSKVVKIFTFKNQNYILIDRIEGCLK